MELLIEHHYVHHVLRMPADGVARPGATARSRTSTRRSTCRCRGRASWAPSGKLVDWDRTGRSRPDRRCRRWSSAPQHDTMDPALHGDDGRAPFRTGRYLHCPNGSHMAMYDDQETYFAGLVDFLLDPSAES